MAGQHRQLLGLDARPRHARTCVHAKGHRRNASLSRACAHRQVGTCVCVCMCVAAHAVYTTIQESYFAPDPLHPEHTKRPLPRRVSHASGSSKAPKYLRHYSCHGSSDTYCVQLHTKTRCVCVCGSFFFLGGGGSAVFATLNCKHLVCLNADAYNERTWRASNNHDQSPGCGVRTRRLWMSCW